jgi:hypothetical protein
MMPEPMTTAAVTLATESQTCQRMALVAPSSWDEQSRTATVVISTDADVGDGVQLVHERSAIRWPGRPLPMDIDHQRTSASCWGAITAMDLGRAEDGSNALVGTVQVDGPDEAMAVAIPRLRNGSARFSVDARIYRWQRASADQPLDRAIDWEPVAVSLVIAGQDPASVMRSVDAMTESTLADPPMSTATEKAGGDPAATAPADTAVTQPAIVTAPAAVQGFDPAPDEVARELHIRRAAGAADLPEAVVQDLIRSTAGKDLPGIMTEVVRAARVAIEAKAPVHAGHPARIEVTRDAGDTFLRGLQEGVDARCKAVKTPTDLGRQYARLSVIDMAKEYLETMRGFSRVDVRMMGINELIDRAFHTTSDLQNVLMDSANKTLLRGYEEEVQTWRVLANQSDNIDFKPNFGVQLNATIVPEKILENGEYKSGTFSDGKITYQLSEYGKSVGISRRMLINDDLSALSRIAPKLGAGCSLLESNLTWALLTEGSLGATVSLDGKALFHADHSNTGTGAVGIAGLDAGKVKLKKQTAPAQANEPKTPLNLTPAYLIVPPELDTAASQVVSSALLPQYAPNALNAVNPFAGTMQVISEARLSDDSTAMWYLAASPSRIDMIQFGYLAGEGGPTITTTEKRNPDGVEMLVRHDFYVTIADWRGFYRSTGV